MTSVTSHFPIPEAALARHIAVLGETGAGKTYTTKKLIEHLAGESYRICILDTVKSDWWGLTSSASGKKAGLPFQILGGPRGHVPLHASSGAVIGELVGKGKLPLSIIDMADFRPGGPQQFFEEFAEALWKHMQGVLYLVIEEAHELAPKERAGFGRENMAVYWAKKLATGGRSKGLRLIIASQRTQSVHNALLSSCGTMVALALSFPADQKPVKDWLDANVRDKDVRERVKKELAFLPTGTAWVACAKENFFDRVKMPPLATFDNSQTPGKESGAVQVTTAPVDRGQLRSLIGDAVAEAEANDPEKLKAEIARLKKGLSTSSTTTEAAKENKAALDAARSEGFNAGRAQILDLIGPRLQQIADHNALILNSQNEIAGYLIELHADAVVTLPRRHTKSGPKAAAHHGLSLPEPSTRVPEPAKPAVAEGAAGTNLMPQDARFLTAIAYWAALGDQAPTRQKIGAIVGLSYQTGNFKNRLGSLRSAGLITYPRDGAVSLTPAGAATAPDPDTGTTVRDSLAKKLTPRQMQVIDLLLSTTQSEMSRAEIGAALALSPDTGNFKNLLGSLRTLDVIDYPTAGVVALSAWVRA